jgi:hypothetical protein
VESDCQMLIKAAEAMTEDRSQWSGLVEEIKAACQLLPAYRFKHVKRDGNVVAHQLAQQAIKHRECVVRRLSAPQCVHNQCVVEAEGAGRSPGCNADADT